MRWSFILSLTLLCALALTGCGFRPLYATPSITDAGTATSLAAVEISAIPDQSGVTLRNHLLDRLHAHGATTPQYQLTVSPVSESREDLDITVDEDATRSQLRQTTSITLTRLNTGEVMLQRSMYAIASYNILESRFATRVAAQNARDNNLDDLARQIEQAVVLALRNADQP